MVESGNKHLSFSHKVLNCVPNNSLDWSKLKAVADDKINAI